MFGTYQRLRLHVSATPREVIKAAQGKLKKAARYSREQRAARHAFYRQMLEYHQGARDLVKAWRL